MHFDMGSTHESDGTGPWISQGSEINRVMASQLTSNKVVMFAAFWCNKRLNLKQGFDRGALKVAIVTCRSSKVAIVNRAGFNSDSP